MTDFKIISDNARMWTESVDNTSNGLRGLGAGTDDTLQKAVFALKLAAGSAALINAVKGVIEARKAIETAEAVATTGVRVAQGPIGWGIIAMAAGIAVSTGAVLYGVCSKYDLKGNLSNPSEAKMIAQTAGVLI